MFVVWTRGQIDWPYLLFSGGMFLSIVLWRHFDHPKYAIFTPRDRSSIYLCGQLCLASVYSLVFFIYSE